MSATPTLVLVPLIAAFLVFVLRFYARESASSKTNPSFLLAVATVLIAGGFLVLQVTDLLPPYGTIGFGLIGFILLATAIIRMFRL